MGNWHEVKLYRTGDDPCFGCEAGWATISEKYENGKWYQKFDSCHENCPKLKNGHLIIDNQGYYDDRNSSKTISRD